MQWRPEGNAGSVRRRAMAAMGSMPSYEPPPGVEAAWKSRDVREGSDYKRAADSFSYGTSSSQPMNCSTAGMLAHPD